MSNPVVTRFGQLENTCDEFTNDLHERQAQCQGQNSGYSIDENFSFYLFPPKGRTSPELRRLRVDVSRLELRSDSALVLYIGSFAYSAFLVCIGVCRFTCAWSAALSPVPSKQQLFPCESMVMLSCVLHTIQ